MEEAVAGGVFPGAVLLVARRDEVVFSRAFGMARLVPQRPMKEETPFDLASLTKPLAAAVAVMILVQEGRLHLDETLGKALKGFAETEKAEITVRQLLSHTSGLPDYRPYFKELVKVPPHERKGMLRGLLLGEGLIHEPGKVSFYSDLGFMILAWLIEAATEKPLDYFVEDAVYRPLGLKDLFFLPVKDSQGRWDHPCAATEDCPWRGKTLEGEVHDENAYALGGVGGHAGLFGTAQATYTLLLELLNTYEGGADTGLFHQAVVKAFFQRHSRQGSWALGFDTPTRPDSSSGRHFSDESVGHLGFTGTSFWMDLAQGIIMVLLTNRVHPKRDNEGITDFRPLLHDTVMDVLIR
jgi:CubicO group peptidase (beta-lactamase class C family)